MLGGVWGSRDLLWIGDCWEGGVILWLGILTNLCRRRADQTHTKALINRGNTRVSQAGRCLVFLRLGQFHVFSMFRCDYGEVLFLSWSIMALYDITILWNFLCSRGEHHGLIVSARPSPRCGEMILLTVRSLND